MPDLYQANSRSELAAKWLKVWYLAERLADNTDSASCAYSEGEFGAGKIQIELACCDARSLAKSLLEFAPAFDPDDLEACSLIYDEASEWLEKRANSVSWFPNLEQHYRDDAENAAEEESGD